MKENMAEQIIRDLLQQIIKEHKFEDYDLKIVPFTSEGANYTSILYNVTLSKCDDVVHMFAKVAAVGEKMRSQAPKFYETEQFAYTKLLKVYEQLEEDHNVPQEHRLTFAKFYGCNPKQFEETIVLENLLMKGYKAYDRFKTFDWEYAKAAISNLAKFHGLSFAYGKYYPEEFGKTLENLKFEFDTSNEQMASYFEMVISKAIGVRREENKDKLKRFFTAFIQDQFMEYYKWTRTPVIGHCDYRPSNLMHKFRDDGTIDIKIVDLQTLQGSNPIIDLLYFIFTGSDEEFRGQYFYKLLDHYYTELNASMKRLDLNPDEVYSRTDFDEELKERLPFGLTTAVYTLPIVIVDAKDAPKVDENLDLTDFATDKFSDLYGERLNGIINDYIKFGILK